MPIVEPMTFRELKPEDVNPLSDLVNKGLQSFEFGQKAYFEPQKSAADILAQQLANRINQPKAENAKAITQADLQKEQLGNAAEQIKNKYLDAMQQADLKKSQAMVNYYNSGAGRGGVYNALDAKYLQNIGLDNPQLNGDPDKIRAAANAISQGIYELPGNIKLNPMSQETKDSYDAKYLKTSTSKLVSSGVLANQADAELTALVNHIKPVMLNTGTTYANKSPEQIALSFSNKPEDQDRLGDIIGARSLQYAIAQLRNRIDMGEPGVQATKELMDNSGQIVTLFAPRLTGRARQRAQDFVDKGVRKALAARNEYGVGASGAAGRPAVRGRTYNLNTGKFEK